MNAQPLIRAVTIASLVLVVVGGIPGSLASTTYPNSCEATEEAPVCYFDCPVGALVEMTVYGPGEPDPYGHNEGNWVMMAAVCGGAGPVPNSGSVEVVAFMCADASDEPPEQLLEQPGYLYDQAVDEVERTVLGAIGKDTEGCSTQWVFTAGGFGECILEAGSRATCAVLASPPKA